MSFEPKICDHGICDELTLSGGLPAGLVEAFALARAGMGEEAAEQVRLGLTQVGAVSEVKSGGAD